MTDEHELGIADRGHINAGSPHTVFDRYPIDLPDLVRQIWTVRYSVPDAPLHQRVLGYPAVNVVFEPDVVALHGPQQRVGVRTLTGDGWAVGLLFRPAAAPLLTATHPVQLIGAEESISIPGHERIAEQVARIMSRPGDVAADREEITGIMRSWLAPMAEQITDAGRLANRASQVAEMRDDILTTTALAHEVHASTRTVERVVRAHTGFGPKWLIECRRMQRAATTLYAHPDTELSTLAIELGFSDHAHFSRRYREVIGETPGQTRAAGRAARG